VTGPNGAAANAALLPFLRPQTDLLIASVRALAAEGDAAFIKPSLCAGWTRGHVVSHLARNADALGNLVTWATTGIPTPMYAGQDARDADIAAGATREPAAQLRDLIESADRFEAAARRLRPEHDPVPLEGRAGLKLAGGDLVFLRLREVGMHHVDLACGFGFADLPPELTLVFLDAAIARIATRPDAPCLRLRTDEGDEWTIGGAPEPDSAADSASAPTSVRGSRSGLLAWLSRSIDDDVTSDRPLPRLPFGG